MYDSDTREISLSDLLEAATTAHQVATLNGIFGDLDSGWTLGYRTGQWKVHVCSLEIMAGRAMYSTAFTLTPGGIVSAATFRESGPEDVTVDSESVGRGQRWETPSELVLNEVAPRGDIALFLGRWVRAIQSRVDDSDLVRHMLAEANKALVKRTQELIGAERRAAELRGELLALGAWVNALHGSPDVVPPRAPVAAIPPDWSRLTLRYIETVTSTASFDRCEIDAVLAAMGGTLAEVDHQDLLLRLVDHTDMLTRAAFALKSSPHILTCRAE